jgi:hypothetical protein
MPSKKEKITLYLAPWQTRIVNDFMPRRKTKLNKLIISIAPTICPASYKIPPSGITKDEWLFHLTDEQMAIIKEGFNLKTSISSINITGDLIKNKHVVFK